MTAAAKDRNTPQRDGEIITIGVAASTKLFGGTMVAKNASGYAVKPTDAANLVVMGVAENQADNSAGANLAIDVKVRRRCAFWLKNSASNAVTIASIGANVYALDDQTVTTAAGTNSVVAGKCLGVDATLGVLVEI